MPLQAPLSSSLANQTPASSSFRRLAPRGLRSVGVIGLLALGLAACSSTPEPGPEGGGGNTLSNFFFYGGATVPPVAPPPADDIECPPVLVTEGGAAIRVGGGDSGAVRHQISIGNLARECTPTGNGGYTLKIGAEGLALLGPAGGGTRSLSTPIRFTVRRGDQVIADRTRQVAIAIPPGQSQGSFLVIEENIVVPPGPEVRIEVGLGAGPRQTARRPRG